MAKISEATGIEMRVFPRDSHLDIMNQFLKDGEFMSIPVAVFYTRDLGYICHWIERPAVAGQDQAQIREEVKQENPDADDQKIRDEVRARTRERFPSWQQASVQEMREMLGQKLSMS